MKYLNKQELQKALNDIPKIETKANEFINELYKNGNYTDNEVLSFIENPNKVYLIVQKIGYEDANRFSISTQRELLEKQADETAGRLKQLAASIFFDTSIKYNDINKTCYVNEGSFKIDYKKVNEVLTKKFTYELTIVQEELYNKLENFTKILNSLNSYAKQVDAVSYIDINTQHYKFLKGGLNVFRERMPYNVDIEAIVKSNIK